MKVTNISRTSKLAVPLLACCLATQTLAVDHYIGLNFLGQPGPIPLGSAEVAGVVPQASWNNIATATATSGTNIALLDDSGNSTDLSLEYLGNDNWNNDGLTGTPDERLMWGILKTSGSGTELSFTIRGVPAGTYDVYVYSQLDGDGAYVNTTLGGTTYYTISEHFFLGSYIQGLNTVNGNGQRDTANYVKFTGVSPSAGVIAFTVASPVSSPIDQLGVAAVQLVGTNSFPANTRPPAITLQPVNQFVHQGDSGTFQLLTDGPWSIQWYSNNVPVSGATENTFTTAPLTDEAGTTNLYFAVVSNNVTAVTSSTVHLNLLPPLPPGGYFYEPFDYEPGPLANQGAWSVLNTAGITDDNGLSYTDSEGNSLQVGGRACIAEIDWDPDSNIPRKTFSMSSFGGDETTNYISYVFDFRNLSTNNSGYVGVSVYNLDNDGLSEQFFLGKRWYDDFLGFESAPGGVFEDSEIPYLTNGFLVVRLESSGGVTTADLFFNPPLSGLEGETPVISTLLLPLPFNTLGVNAGEWDGPKGEHRNDFTPPGPLIDEFRFGTTYASVAPIAPPALTIQAVGTDVQISWPTAATGFTLEQTDNLLSGPWTPAPAGNPVTIPVSPGARFYRLVK